jgi:hypothetical protein
MLAPEDRRVVETIRLVFESPLALSKDSPALSILSVMRCHLSLADTPIGIEETKMCICP